MSDIGKQKFIKKLKSYIENTKDDWNYITPKDFYEKFYIKKNKMKDIFLLDLRKKEEFKKFHIKGAKNIFWLDLLDEKNIKKLPKNKKIFLICYVGHTSSQAMVLLKLLGYDVVSIKFGYGISPIMGVPVAGWLNYKYPVI
jgi:rhodanese-related sulfurtransferase